MANSGTASALNLRPDFDELSLEEQVNLVRRAWQDPIPRLLIFDSCEEETLFTAWRPLHGGCSLLVTTRLGRWSPTLGLTLLALETIKRATSIQLLQSFRPDLTSEEGNKIAEALGDLPLALHLAGSYLNTYRYDITPQDYLAQLGNSPDQNLLGHPSLQGIGTDHSPTEHQLNLKKTFSLGLEQLDPSQERDILAKDLLARAAYFAPGEPPNLNV